MCPRACVETPTKFLKMHCKLKGYLLANFLISFFLFHLKALLHFLNSSSRLLSRNFAQNYLKNGVLILKKFDNHCSRLYLKNQSSFSNLKMQQSF